MHSQLIDLLRRDQGLEVAVLVACLISYHCMLDKLVKDSLTVGLRPDHDIVVHSSVLQDGEAKSIDGQVLTCRKWHRETVSEGGLCMLDSLHVISSVCRVFLIFFFA